MTDTVISLIANVIDGITLVFFSEIIFGRKYRINRNISILIIILGHIGCQLLQSRISAVILLYAITFVFMLALTYFYKGGFVKHFFVATGITVIGTAAEGIVFAVHNSMGEVAGEGYVVGLMASKAITLIIVSVIRVIIKKTKTFNDRRVSVFIFLCQTISVAVMFLLIYFMVNVPVKYYSILGGMSTLILLLNMCIYYMFDNISELASVNAERIKANDNLVKTEQQYKLITEKYKTVRSYIHDTNKHFSSIRRYLYEGKCNEAIEYIDRAKEMDNIRNDFVNSGNVVIDALVNELKSKCVNKKILCNIDIAINNNDICIEAPDFSIVLGNLLDNAYNAVVVLSEEDDKKIDVKIFTQEEKIVIKVNNTCENADMTKGYGIQNIETVVDKYGGIYYAEQADKSYFANVFIPINDRS